MNLRELRHKIHNGCVFEYEFFWSGPFSQWHPSAFTVDKVRYHNAEQFMMAEKARVFGDTATNKRILAERHPVAIKQLGREVKGYDDSKWSSVRFDIVVRGSVAKFSQNDALKKTLLDTGDKILVEASPKDLVWGIGLDKDHPNASDPTKWPGTNLLGFALCVAREQVRSL